MTPTVIEEKTREEELRQVTARPAQHGGSGLPQHTRRPPWAAVIATLLILFMIGLVPRLRDRLAPTGSEETGGAGASDAATVTVIHPQPAAATQITLPGDVQSIAETTVSARQSGYLVKRLVDIGDHVRRGQVLAVIHSPETDQDRATARANLARSQAGTGQAESDLVKMRANLMQARAGVAHSQAAVAQMRANEATAVANLRKSEHTRQGARAQARLGLATWKRYLELSKQGYVSSQDADTARTTYESSTSAARAAEADVVAAHAAVDAAQQNLHAAEADLESARENVAAAEAAVHSQEMVVRAQMADNQASAANVQKQQVLTGYENVVAPFDGVITARYVDVGALIKADNSGNTSATTNSASASTSTALFGIARSDTVRVMVGVPQAYVVALHDRDQVDVSILEFPGRKFAGQINRKAGGLDPASRTQQVEVDIPNPKGELLSGMYATVSFHQASQDGIVKLPASAFIIDAQGTRVATVDGESKIHLQPVEIGRDYGDQMEVRGGLKTTDTVVDNPPEEISEGQKVKTVTPEATPSGESAKK
jgi:RND family efflux transporter MFP subunit